jgi:1,4-dihydroxy-2-naphthoyl-CoA synthase
VRGNRFVVRELSAAELDQKVEQWIDNLLLNSPAAMRASKDLLREVGDGADPGVAPLHRKRHRPHPRQP